MVKFLMGLVVLNAAMLAMPATATTINWSGLSDGALTGIYTEGGYQFDWAPDSYSQLLGGVRVVGNDPTLSSGNSATSFAVTRIGGGLFSFDSIAGANLNGVVGPVGDHQPSHESDYLVFGYLNGTQVTGQQSTGGENTLLTSASNSNMLVDSLVVILGGGVFPTDIEAVTNLALTADPLTPVPEPAMLGLFGLGAIGLGLSRRREA